jgi:IS5 family transposase
VDHLVQEHAVVGEEGVAVAVGAGFLGHDGHTLKETIASVKVITGLEPERTFVDKGYRGHDYGQPMRVYRSGQRRG